MEIRAGYHSAGCLVSDTLLRCSVPPTWKSVQIACRSLKCGAFTGVELGPIFVSKRWVWGKDGSGLRGDNQQTQADTLQLVQQSRPQMVELTSRAGAENRPLDSHVTYVVETDMQAGVASRFMWRPQSMSGREQKSS